MPIGVPVDISSNSDYVPLSQIMQQNRAAKAQNIALREQQKQERQKQLLEATLKAHTVVDPTTGAAATDQQAALGDLYRADPILAQSYEESLQAKATAKVEAQRKAVTAQHEDNKYGNETKDRVISATGEELGGVDEDGDQAIAAQQYAQAVSNLKARGIDVPPEDQVYSKGKVKFFKNRLIGPKEQFKTDAKLEEIEKRGVQARETEGVKTAGKVAVANVNGGYKLARGAAGDKAAAARAAAGGPTPAVTPIIKGYIYRTVNGVTQRKKVG